MSLNIRYQSTWKDIFKPWVRYGGQWRECDKVWIRHGGQWKQIWTLEAKWGNWSAWQETPISAIPGQRETKSEDQHKSQVYAMCYNFEDHFSPRMCHDRRTQDQFIASPSCHNCGYRKAHEWGHYRGSWANADGWYQCLCWKMYDSGVRWGYGGKKDGKSDWTSGTGGADTSEYRVTDHRVAWAYRDNLNDPPR